MNLAPGHVIAQCQLDAHPHAQLLGLFRVVVNGRVDDRGIGDGYDDVLGRRHPSGQQLTVQHHPSNGAYIHHVPCLESTRIDQK